MTSHAMTFMLDAARRHASAIHRYARFRYDVAMPLLITPLPVHITPCHWQLAISPPLLANCRLPPSRRECTRDHATMFQRHCHSPTRRPPCQNAHISHCCHVTPRLLTLARSLWLAELVWLVYIVATRHMFQHATDVDIVSCYC